MSDPPSREQDPGSGEPEAHTTSVGLYLAGQRRLRGISIDDLAARTRIPRRNIERLEAGAFDAAPDGFARGFVRTVAQALGLDADEAVMRLMTEPQVDESLLLRERRARVLLRGAILAGGVLIAVTLWKLFAALVVSSDPVTPPPVVYRRDPVKLLAADVEEHSQVVEAPPSAADPPLRLASPELSPAVTAAVEVPRPPAPPASPIAGD